METTKQMGDDLLQELLGEDSDEALSSNTSMRTYHQIYKDLTINEDIILVIDKKDENKLRKGLSAVKAKHNSKLKEANLPPSQAVLEFIVHKQADLPKEQIKIQIVLKSPPAITVHQIIIPQGESLE